MAFCWRADDGPLLVLFGSSPLTKKMLDPLLQNFLDPRMDSDTQYRICAGPLRTLYIVVSALTYLCMREVKALASLRICASILDKGHLSFRWWVLYHWLMNMNVFFLNEHQHENLAKYVKVFTRRFARHLAPELFPHKMEFVTSNTRVECSFIRAESWQMVESTRRQWILLASGESRHINAYYFPLVSS